MVKYSCEYTCKISLKNNLSAPLGRHINKTPIFVCKKREDRTFRAESGKNNGHKVRHAGSLIGRKRPKRLGFCIMYPVQAGPSKQERWSRHVKVSCWTGQG